MMSRELYRVFIAVELTDKLKEPMIKMQKELMSSGGST